MFDTRKELQKWKEELVSERRELLFKRDKMFYDGIITYEEDDALSDQIAILTMKICIVDREYQMCGVDKDETS